MARIFRKYEEPEVAPKAPTPSQHTEITETSGETNDVQSTRKAMSIHPDILNRVQKSISPSERVAAHILLGKSLSEILPGFAPPPRVVTLYQPWLETIQRALSAYQMALQPIEGGGPQGTPIRPIRQPDPTMGQFWEEQGIQEDARSRLMQPRPRDIGAIRGGPEAVRAQSTTGSGLEIMAEERPEPQVAPAQRPGMPFSLTGERAPGLPTARARMSDPSQAMFPGTPAYAGAPGTGGSQSVTGRETYPVQRPQPTQPNINTGSGYPWSAALKPGTFGQRIRDAPVKPVDMYGVVPGEEHAAFRFSPNSMVGQETADLPHAQPNPTRPRGGTPLGHFSQVYSGFTDETPGTPYSPSPSRGGPSAGGGMSPAAGGAPPVGGAQPPPSLTAPKPAGVPSLSLAGAPPRPGTQGIGGAPRPTGMAVGPSGQPTGVGGGGSPMPARPSIGGFNRSLPDANDLFRASYTDEEEEPASRIGRMMGVRTNVRDSRAYGPVQVPGPMDSLAYHGQRLPRMPNPQRSTIGRQSKSLANVESLFSMM